MKQTLQNRFPRWWLLLAFVLNFAIAAAALLPYMIRDGGLLLVAADFDAEQLSSVSYTHLTLTTSQQV